MIKEKLSNVIEALRILGCIVGIQIGYWGASDPTSRLEIMTVVLVLCLSGTVAFESLVLGESASKKIGYTPNRDYQIQSGLNSLAVVIALGLIKLFGWNTYAYLALLTVVLVFFSLSSLNHAWTWYKEGNRKLVNVLRPFMTIALIAAAVPAVVMAL
jgi:hypothetical protein